MIAKAGAYASLRYIMVSLCIAAAGCALSYGSSAVSATDPSALRAAIRRSAGYLTQACGPDGKFLYRINPLQLTHPSDKYNILRHAGALYALSSRAEITRDTHILQACARAASFMKSQTLAPLPDRSDLLAVWSYPSIEHSTAPAQAKLGGTGLALIALLCLERTLPGTTPLSDLRRMGEFILFMQKEDGSFFSKYIPSAGGRSDLWTSLYYPGEAALGLVMLYERDQNVRWLQAAANALAYLARVRSGHDTAPADHWALLATAILLPHYARCQQPVSSEALLQHAIQICESILRDRPSFSEDSPRHGTLVADASTCATATRLEGLLAALTFLPSDGSGLRRRIVPAVREGISFLIRSQITAGPHSGGVPRHVCQPFSGADGTDQACGIRAAEIRIDYVQHTLSALMMYQRIASAVQVLD